MKTRVAHRRMKIERVYRPYLTATEAVPGVTATIKQLRAVFVLVWLSLIAVNLNSSFDFLNLIIMSRQIICVRLDNLWYPRAAPVLAGAELPVDLAYVKPRHCSIRYFILHAVLNLIRDTRTMPLCSLTLALTSTRVTHSLWNGFFD
jgi:hypothetical protein